MGMRGGETQTTMVYHDGRDWIIERRGQDYWSFPLDGEGWMQGLPPGLTVEDVETDCEL